MQRLYQITLPGLSVTSHAARVRARLLATFLEIDEVFATTIPATLLILYRGEDRIDAWLAVLSSAVQPQERQAPMHQRSAGPFDGRDIAASKPVRGTQPVTTKEIPCSTMSSHSSPPAA